MRRRPGEAFKRAQKMIRTQSRHPRKAGKIMALIRIVLNHPHHSRYARERTWFGTRLPRRNPAFQQNRLSGNFNTEFFACCAIDARQNRRSLRNQRSHRPNRRDPKSIETHPRSPGIGREPFKKFRSI